MTLDHLVPRALGGTDHVRNLKAACHQCNWTRGMALSGPWRWDRVADPDELREVVLRAPSTLRDLKAKHPNDALARQARLSLRSAFIAHVNARSRL